jgi:hypothetical protein
MRCMITENDTVIMLGRAAMAEFVQSAAYILPVWLCNAMSCCKLGIEKHRIFVWICACMFKSVWLYVDERWQECCSRGAIDAPRVF